MRAARLARRRRGARGSAVALIAALALSSPALSGQKADLKRKYSTADQLNRTEQKIRAEAWDVSVHFRTSFQGRTPFKGQLVAINFFASWCAPCEVEAPQLNALAAQGIRIVGISYKDAPSKTQVFLARVGDPYVQRLVDHDGRAGIEFGVTGVPETFLVGRDGVILDKHTGPITQADAEMLAARLR